MANPKIEVIWNTVVDSIEGDDAGIVKQLKLRNDETGEESTLAATGVFIFIGFKPNTSMLGQHVEHDSMGYIITDSSMQTSIPGLYAAGDLRAQLTRQITTAAGDATTAAIAVEKYLSEGNDASRKEAAGG